VKHLLKRNLKGSRILFLFTLSWVVYIIMLTVTIPEVMRFSGGLKILDMMPEGYNHDYVVSLLGSLGEKGRHAYLFHQIPLDMIYPFLFGVSNCLILAWLFHKLGKSDSPYFKLCYLPLIAGLFDYCENFGIISILTIYPRHPIIIYRIAEMFSVLKSLFTTLYFMVLLVMLIIFGINRIFLQNRP
jgi:hypothetical protein